MAKKKRKYLIKLNNKVRNYFNGLPFDEGVLSLDDEQLMALAMSLELRLTSLSREDLLRALRRAWSEGDHIQREHITHYLLQGKRPKEFLETKAEPIDKVSKILDLLEELPHTKEEENSLLESFIEAKSSKLTQEKIANKLAYIRLQNRLKYLEEQLEATFSTLGEMEFYQSYSFHSKEFDFSKLLLTRTPPLDLEALWQLGEESILTHLKNQKAEIIAQKQTAVNSFMEEIERYHPWLAYAQMIEHIKQMAPDTDLYHIPLTFERVEGILHRINEKYELLESTDHYIIEKSKTFVLFKEKLHYRTSVSYTKEMLWAAIWRGDILPIDEDLNQVNEELVSHFNMTIDALYDHMLELSQGLNVPDDRLESHIVQFLAPQIQASQTLKLKEKSKRRILYHYGEYIKPLKERHMREELLAKSIRDFKNLFPLARSLKRKISFHVGPTNSGKTYAALQQLKTADTGYYLAPLRLLALEGYETLKKEGVRISLITGEEEIIDEESTHVSSTIEMLNNSVDVEVCVIDEIQMINDRDRGWAWANALIGAPAKKVILTGSSDALKAVQELCFYLDEPLEVIPFERKNPLVLLKKSTPIKNVEKQSAIVAFSRREVLSFKQIFSEFHRVSVIYGNLSPEVRREEARRFREGESDILVATDAIAMGLNLPIKSILFAKDNKFDGLRRRELTPSEILQIAGRAGRYGFEERGYIGALDESTLQTITKKFHTPLTDIELPFAVMANLEHVLLIGEILETDNLTNILTFFAENMEFDGPFEAANIESMLEIAAIVDEYNLDLITRYHLSCAPASISSPYIESVFHRYIRSLEKGSEVLYIPPRDLPPFAQTNDMLLNAEDRVREISLYLWLSFKFQEYFPDTQKAIDSRVRLNHFIENSLKKGHFVKSCNRCGKVLDFSYRFSICENCYTLGKRGEKSYRTRSKR